MLKGLLFDYGGTIDTNGRHWGSVLFNAYYDEGIVIDKELFVKVFAYGERQLAIQPIITPDFTFHQVLVAKLKLHASFLAENGIDVPLQSVYDIADRCDALVRINIERVKPLLAICKEKYRIAMVSNFYGNLHSVLNEYGLLPYFEHVIESAVVGVRKPDPAIYKLGYESLNLAPEEALVIGDSYKKDIVPAFQNRCHSAWINVEGWDEPTEQTFEHKEFVIASILELPTVLEQLS